MQKIDISKGRQKLKQLIGEEQKISQVFMGGKPLLKGSVYKMMTKCGKRGCKCEREGELHSAWKISWSHDGKIKTRCITKKGFLGYKRLSENYRRYRQARARLVRIHDEQIKIVDILEKAKRTEIS